MGIFFTLGEKKIRPGVYQRYENNGSSMASAVNGIVAVAFRSDWGALGEVITLSSDQAASLSILLGSGSGNTVDVIREVFAGGAVTVYAVRLGSGGTNGTAELKDTSTGPVTAINLTCRYPGSRALKITVREKLGDASAREMLVTEGSAVREKITFPASDAGEVDALVAAINEQSVYFTAAKAASYAGTGKLAITAETAITPGTDPTVNTDSYSDALALLEPFRFNAVCVDTEDTAVHALLSAYIERVYQGGKLEAFAVMGEKTGVALTTRMEHAKAFNSYNVVYVGGGWEDGNGEKVEGVRAAARLAGMIAATPSSQSLTHAVISGAVKPLERLTENQYVQAIQSGMLTTSVSGGGTVWIEAAITTLVNPAGEDDDGWKKIKRTKIRKELMARVSDTVEPLMGKVLNNSDGQANVIAVVKKNVLDAMVSEGKLLSGPTIALDAANPPVGDSAWFLITADDVDAIERSYFTYGFRYAASE